MKRTLKTPFLLVSSFLALASAPRLPAQCYAFTREHVDLLAILWDPAEDTLRLMASDDTHGGSYASNQCVVVCPESMRLTLPSGTPLGEAGEVLWVLPQNPYPEVPYVGISAEALAPGSFNDPMTIRLTRLEGPGHFLLWQTVGFGNFDVKMDTRDGIDPADRITPGVGAHEHYNWGFSTSGVYRLYFQASGRRPGQTADLVSEETPFTFHILPLTPFEIWQAAQWPCECRTDLIAPGVDPDVDGGVNAIEYALGTDPNAATAEGWPEPSLVTVEGQTYGALSYTRVKSATDCVYEIVVTSDLSSDDWRPLTLVHRVEDRGATELVTVRDELPVPAYAQRFYRLQVRLSMDRLVSQQQLFRLRDVAVNWAASTDHSASIRRYYDVSRNMKHQVLLTRH